MNLSSRSLTVVWLVTAWVGAGVSVTARTTVEITADRVSLRAADDAGAEVVFQAGKGDRLEADELGGSWVAVVPPARADLWVYADLVKDGEVAVSKLQVRSGPGISYRAVGLVEKGARLTVRGREGDWLKIAPPAVCRLWVSADFVRAVGTPVPDRKPVESAPPPSLATVEPDAVASPAPPVPERAAPAPVASVPAAPVPSPVEPVSPLPPKTKPLRPKSPANVVGRDVPPASAAAPKVRPLPAPLEAAPPVREVVVVPQPVAAARTEDERRATGSGVAAGMTAIGRVERVGTVWRRPAEYRLVGDDARGQSVTECYLDGEAARLESLLRQTVRVQGQARWMSGVRHPILRVDDIERLPGSPGVATPDGWMGNITFQNPFER